MAQCSAVIAKGMPCTHKAREDGLCGTHLNSRNHSGPNKFELDQLRHKHDKDVRDLHDRMFGNTNHLTNEEFAVRQAQYARELVALKDRYVVTVRAVKLTHAENIARTGVDPDAAARTRRLNARIEYERLRDQRRAQYEADQAVRRNAFMIEQAQRHIQNVVEADMRNIGEVVHEPIVPRQRQLKDIVNDPQNVHTTEVLIQTKHIVAKVREIPVPVEYRWNPSIMSPTVGEIIAACKLSHHAAAQMFNQYSARTAVYDIEEGIYGKVLDSMWQFVKNSPDKADLCRIIKTELEDNVGMCAQGNLTRICNVLAGYIDGIAPPKSKYEVLGDLFAELMKLDDESKRMSEAHRILTEHNIPADEWEIWTDPLTA